MNTLRTSPFFAFALLALFFPVGQFAQEKGSKKGPSSDRAGTLFLKWDRNKDGSITREELPKQLQGNFERVDSDKNGKISRQEHTQFLNKQRASRTPQLPDSIIKLSNLDYAANDNPRQKLDLYLPKERDTNTKLPLLVYVHGGGWKNGDKDRANRIHPFVASGKYAGASIGYRLSDEATWPAQIHDCKAAIRWLRANAKSHGIDPERIAVWGTSAGGHLVSLLGVTRGVEKLEGTIGPHLNTSSGVRSVINFFGPAELLTMDDHPSVIDHDAPDSPESKMLGGPMLENKDKAREASPITYASTDDAPFLIVHGTEDKLVPYPQSLDFEKALESHQVPTILLTVEKGGHGQGFGTGVDKIVKAFLEKHLLNLPHNLEDQNIPAE